MAQKRNLNVNPYYDDFDSDKNFYKVLFKPGFPVQARELTTLQSILQNQVEDFGSHIFKEGSMVIPGGITYDNQYNAVKLNSSNFGIDISLYIKEYIGKEIVGKNSGITATVEFVALPSDPNIDDVTIYVKYINSDNEFNINSFEDGEELYSNSNIVYGNTTISSGTSFASLLQSNATSIGSAASIDNGVYFIRGYFVNVNKQTILLDEYTNKPSYRVGLRIDELIIGAKDDSSLYDGAKGFSNYAAPGADRLKIELVLTKKAITDIDDTNFVELLRVRDGRIKKIETKTQYNIIRDYLAQRTYEESGNYSVEPFEVSLYNSLNDKIGNDGLFFDDSKTDEGNTPSDNLMCVKVSPGKAYVKGYDVDNTGTLILDVDKPRDTKKIENESIPFTMGNLIRINNVVGTPSLGDTLTLFSDYGSSTTMGVARTYSFNVTDAAYTGPKTKWDLYVYDLQFYTKITLNKSVTDAEIISSSRIEGKNSGAYGYAISEGNNSADVILSDVSGTFSPGEQILVNGRDFSRSILSTRSYNIGDLRRIENSGGSGAYNFSADAFLEKFSLTNGITNAYINHSTGVMQSPGNVFSGVRIGDIIRYSTNTGLETFNEVSGISADSLSITLGAISAGGHGSVFDGSLSTTDTFNVSIGRPVLRNQESAFLYEKVSNKNVASTNLTGSDLYIRAQSTPATVASDGTVDFNTSNFNNIANVNFTNFDADRYSLIINSGSVVGGIGTITSDSFTPGSTSVSFSALTPSDSVILNATLIKNEIKNKVKTYNRSKKIIIDKSDSDSAGSIVGMTTSLYYGLRVQDREISLNYPDVANVLAVYESTNSSDPTLDEITFTSSFAVKTNAIIGENIKSSNSNAVARVVELSTSNHTLGIVYLNSDRFIVGEKVTFEESNLTPNVESINTNTSAANYKDVTGSFILDKGQRDQYYDYSRLVRIDGSSVPSKKLLAIFDYYSVPSNDTGDLFTVLSYDSERYANDIPRVGSDLVRASDILDLRPRVSVFNADIPTASPFTFSSRNSIGTVSRFAAPNEDSVIGYDYYLGRIDKVVVDKYGKIFVNKGTSSESTNPPISGDDVMDIAVITLPPYLFDPTNAQISLIDNKRYTMRDIGTIEDRVQNLEEVTSLSLLEISTQALQIRDARGNDRFKSGFFVDDFKNTNLLDSNFTTSEVDIDLNELRPLISSNTISSQLVPLSFVADNLRDNSVDFELLDTNVKKTGRNITLNYDEVDWITQPLATKVENVNPFHVVGYYGTVKLNPPSDAWVRTIRLGNRNVNGGTFSQGGGLVGAVSTRVSVRDTIVASGSEIWMRSRNTEFSVVNVKPLTKFHQFLDNVKLDVIPKLVEISPNSDLLEYGSSGVFTVGETVEGIDPNSGEVLIRFRVASSNHKYGAYNNPTTKFNINPYVKSENLFNSYSQSSKVLNVDTFSLSEEAQGNYYGFIQKGTKLVGTTSGSVAYVKDLRLISDNYGDLIGSFFIKDPHSNDGEAQTQVVRVRTGTKTFKITSSSVNETPLPGSKLISFAQTKYTSQGTWQQRQRVFTSTTVVTYYDPLAQSFSVGGNVQAPSPLGANDDDNGAFVTAVDLFFAHKPESNDEVKVEIRTVELGTPTRIVVGEPAILRPEDITTSTTGEVATNVKFPSPIYLESGREYAIVLVAETTDQYEVWIARMGEKTVNTQSLPDAESVRYTKQFALGSLFKSQNGSIWTADQYEDMKFKLYKAKFVSSGTAFFDNPTLNVEGTRPLASNAIITIPKRMTLDVGPVTNTDDKDILTPGRKVTGSTSNSGYGFIDGVGAKAASVSVSAGFSGSNYVTDSDVETFTVTGEGSGLKLNITAAQSSNGDGNTGIINVAIVGSSEGHGYRVGDVVGIKTSTVTGERGRGALITIDTIGDIDTLYLTGVQGEYGVNSTDIFRSGDDLKYFVNLTDPGSNTFNTPFQINSTNSSNGSGSNSGNYIRINQFNHGMYSSTNKVKLNGIESSYPATKTTANLTSDGGSIQVEDRTSFVKFEGYDVSTTNIGYLQIGQEVVGYTTITAGTGSSGTIVFNTDGRSVKGVAQSHNIGTLVKKYELNGMSLMRINDKVHDIKEPITADSYHIEISRDADTNSLNRSSDSTNPQLSFESLASLGGRSAKASHNMAFTEVKPSYDVLIPGSSTSLKTQIRTVSGTSVSGNEVSFVDQGYEAVELNRDNKLSTTRIIASKVNEDQYLTNMPNSKSFLTAISLTTNDENISPIISLENCRTELKFARLNRPISNYSEDNRVNLLLSDPHASTYVSNIVRLQNSASSLKVLLSAYRDTSADFRVLYQLIDSDSSSSDQIFTLFPGYDNLEFANEDGFLVLDESKNSGKPDVFVRPSLDNEFLEYQFTADNLGLFNAYRIKIVMSGTNQAKYPRIKELRTIAVV